MMHLPPDKLFKSLFASNLHEIVPNVFIGNALDAKNKLLLKKHVLKIYSLFLVHRCRNNRR